MTEKQTTLETYTTDDWSEQCNKVFEKVGKHLWDDWEVVTTD